MYLTSSSLLLVLLLAGTVPVESIRDPKVSVPNESVKSKEDLNEDLEKIKALPKKGDHKLDESADESKNSDDQIEEDSIPVKGGELDSGVADEPEKPKLDGVIPEADRKNVQQEPEPIDVPVGKTKEHLKQKDPLNDKQPHLPDQDIPLKDKKISLDKESLLKDKDAALKDTNIQEQSLKGEFDHVVGDGVSEIDEDDSSPTLLWFALFSAVTIISVAVYLYRVGLRSTSLSFSPLPDHSKTEATPLMTPVDRLVSSSLLRLNVPPSAVEKYVQAFQSNRIFRVEQLDEATWERLGLPSAIELELRQRFDKATLKPRSAGLALNRDSVLPTISSDNDDIEFDDWSFDEEETKFAI